MLHRLVWGYTCQNSKLLEIACHGSDSFENAVLLVLSCSISDSFYSDDDSRSQSYEQAGWWGTETRQIDGRQVLRNDEKRPGNYSFFFGTPPSNPICLAQMVRWAQLARVEGIFEECKYCPDLNSFHRLWSKTNGESQLGIDKFTTIQN